MLSGHKPLPAPIVPNSWYPILTQIYHSTCSKSPYGITKTQLVKEHICDLFACVFVFLFLFFLLLFFFTLLVIQIDDLVQVSREPRVRGGATENLIGPLQISPRGQAVRDPHKIEEFIMYFYKKNPKYAAVSGQLGLEWSHCEMIHHGW